MSGSIRGRGLPPIAKHAPSRVARHSHGVACTVHILADDQHGEGTCRRQCPQEEELRAPHVLEEAERLEHRHDRRQERHRGLGGDSAAERADGQQAHTGDRNDGKGPGWHDAKALEKPAGPRACGCEARQAAPDTTLEYGWMDVRPTGHAQADRDRDLGPRADLSTASVLAGVLGRVGDLVKGLSLVSY